MFKKINTIFNYVFAISYNKKIVTSTENCNEKSDVINNLVG